MNLLRPLGHPALRSFEWLLYFGSSHQPGKPLSRLRTINGSCRVTALNESNQFFVGTVTKSQKLRIFPAAKFLWAQVGHRLGTRISAEKFMTISVEIGKSRAQIPAIHNRNGPIFSLFDKFQVFRFRQLVHLRWIIPAISALSELSLRLNRFPSTQIYCLCIRSGDSCL